MIVKNHDGPHACLLPDGRRLHLQHGPIDLIVGAEGPLDEVSLAYHQAIESFQDVLETLVRELDVLRRPCAPGNPIAQGTIARLMQEHAQTHAERTFVTPMIAVAGAVADFVLGALTRGRSLDKAYVNNGGDIALMLTTNAVFEVGVCAEQELYHMPASIRVTHGDCVGGVATSGWRGRSFSFGIADAVTVLARSATAADVAATLIANSVDVPNCPRIERMPASDLAPDCDLGARAVTVGVGVLSDGEVESAIDRGRREALSMLRDRRICAAYLTLRGRAVMCGEPSISCDVEPSINSPRYARAGLTPKLPAKRCGDTQLESGASQG
ncbi:MAG: UPF0280 family protein [Hyphomicrobiaceae bacterium]